MTLMNHQPFIVVLYDYIFNINKLTFWQDKRSILSTIN
jgi:hypothetical protein